MNDHTRENLTELLRRFMDETAAETAAKDIDAGDSLLRAFPVPAPSNQTVTAIKVEMVAVRDRHRWRVRVLGGSLAAAAAVIMALVIGRPGSGPGTPPGLSFATLIPRTIWESDDLARDDLQLVYFNGEVRQIEAQMRALEADEDDPGGTASPDDLEGELMAIETELWKG